MSLPMAGSNMGDTARPGLPLPLPTAWPTTSSAPGGTDHRAATTDPGAGGSTDRWNRPHMFQSLVYHILNFFVFWPF
jgi:hypothetical protein